MEPDTATPVMYARSHDLSHGSGRESKVNEATPTMETSVSALATSAQSHGYGQNCGHERNVSVIHDS